MNILIFGSGRMSRAIAYDLCMNSQNEICIVDRNQKALDSAASYLPQDQVSVHMFNIDHRDDVQTFMRSFDIAISAVPYSYNYQLAKSALATQTHFIDLGGNNDMVQKERGLFVKAKKNGVTIIPDCGLAPGLTSVITKDIVEQLDHVDCVQLRVGGLPIHPTPPLNYQIVFSPYGLINEYVEDAILLDHGKIVKKQSLTELEKIRFPHPFGNMEAFVTSGGCSTLPYTYKDKIFNLNYKTIRYPGHCEKFKTLLELGFAKQKKIKCGNSDISPREVLATLLMDHLPHNEKDVVLLKVVSKGEKNHNKIRIEYVMTDYYDDITNMTAMMRTTGFPVSIIAQMIEEGIITSHGVFCPEEIVPCKPFFDELKKRHIIIKKHIRNL
jgi:lysine 6-dehydrogenase